MSDLYARDTAAMSGLQKLRFFPQAVVGGKGALLRTEDGRELIDLSAAWGAASLGYGHPALVAAVSAAVADPAGASVLSSANGPATALAERLIALFPSDQPQRVWLGHSGSDANEAALRAVRHATGRQGIISFAGGFPDSAMFDVEGIRAASNAALDEEPGAALQSLHAQHC